MEYYNLGDIVSIEGGFYKVIALLKDGRNIATHLTEKEMKELQSQMDGSCNFGAESMPYFDYEI